VIDKKYKNMQPFERSSIAVYHTKKTKQAAVTLLTMLTEGKLLAEKCGGHDRHLQPKNS